MHICMDCYESYDGRFLVKVDRYNYVCPKSNCSGDVVEIDDLIAPAIIELNQKGYITEYCCSGHWNSNPSAYIAFAEDVELPYIPETFKRDKENPHRPGETIRKLYYEYKDMDEYDFVIECNRELISWAKSLPSLYDEE